MHLHHGMAFHLKVKTSENQSVPDFPKHNLWFDRLGSSQFISLGNNINSTKWQLDCIYSMKYDQHVIVPSVFRRYSATIHLKCNRISFNSSMQLYKT